MSRKPAGGLRPDLAKNQTVLDSLNPGSVILDTHGRAWQNDRCYWYEAYGDSSGVSSFELAQYVGTVTVLLAVTDLKTKGGQG